MNPWPVCSGAGLLQARKIEAELDAKLVSFARVASTYDQTYTRGETGLAADQVGPPWTFGR